MLDMVKYLATRGYVMGDMDGVALRVCLVDVDRLSHRAVGRLLDVVIVLRQGRHHVDQAPQLG